MDFVKLTSRRFFIIIIVSFFVAILTPHLIRGHILLPEDYAESSLLLMDIAVAYIFYRMYLRDMEKINHEKNKIENQLIDSYRYIGETNNKMELFSQFINLLSQETIPSDSKYLFNSLLKNLVVSVVKTNQGVLRFVARDSYRTLSEFGYYPSDDIKPIKLSNKESIEHEYNFLEKDGVAVVKSSNNGRIVCLFSYPNTAAEEIDSQLIATLINQIHLLFLATNSEEYK